MSGRVRRCFAGGGRFTLALVLLVSVLSSAATAQTQTSSTSRADRRQPKWEISIQAGGAHPGVPQQGIAALPDQGELFTAVNGRLSRTVPTWFFAYGSSLLNQVITDGQTAAMTTFDEAVFLPRSNYANTWTVGVRVSRALNPRASIEGSFDYSRSRLGITDAVVPAADATIASYVSVWTALLAKDQQLFQNVNVSATRTVDANPAGHQVMASGALIINILTRRRNTPYAIIGAGLMTHGGASPSVTLVGRIRTTLNGTAPVDETDTMTLRYDMDRTLVTVTMGVGWKRMITERWGIRGEVREQVSSNPVTNRVTTTPQIALTSTGPAQGAGATNTGVVAVQFSNIAGSATVSSLGSSMTSQPMFRMTGMENRVSFTGGIFWRF